MPHHPHFTEEQGLAPLFLYSDQAWLSCLPGWVLFHSKGFLWNRGLKEGKPAGFGLTCRGALSRLVRSRLNPPLTPRRPRKTPPCSAGEKVKELLGFCFQLFGCSLHPPPSSLAFTELCGLRSVENGPNQVSPGPVSVLTLKDKMPIKPAASNLKRA